MPALIGVDIGTQGVKAVIFSQDGRALASAFRKSHLNRPEPGVVEEDPEFQLQSVCEGIRECVETSGATGGDVAAVGIDGQMAGIIGIGADGRNVTPYDSWLDERCGPMARFMSEQAGAAVIEKSGGPPSFNHGPKILWWKRVRPHVYESIASFVQPSGYVVMRLCGLAAEQAFIDSTYLHFSGFADNWGLCWDDGLCREFDVSPGKLPRIVAPHEHIGELTQPMAERCGLTAGTPLVAGCGDTAASFLACGAAEPGIGVDVAGTASVFAGTVRSATPDVEHGMLNCGRSAVPGLWHPYAYIGGGGMNLEWFRESVAGSEDQRLSLETLDAMAGEVAGEDDLPFFAPHLSGRACPSQPGLRGAWAGVRPEHGTAHLYHALLEAVPLEYAAYLDAIREVCPDHDLSELRVTGGGERSAVWNQIKADVLGVPLVQIAGSEGAPRGAAMLAGFGVELIPDLRNAASAWVGAGRATQPDPERVCRAAARKGRYRDLLELLDQWSHV